MITAEDVRSLSREEKLNLLQTLWDELSPLDQEIESPAWHEEVLKQSEQLVQEGKATFSDWDSAKVRIRAAADK